MYGGIFFREDLEALTLSVLENGPMHGYEIARRIKLYSEEVLSAGDGKLYPCLKKLEQDGCVLAEWVKQGNRPDRKTYALTVYGAQELAKKRAAWEKFSRAVGALMQTVKPEANHA